MDSWCVKREFESILNFRIPDSRRLSSKYTNTFVAVQKIWLRPNAVGQPTIMHNGEGFKYGVRMIFTWVVNQHHQLKN
jgi:hypothetical protein